jgi:CRISPR system Cascade subunit CasB
MPETQDKLEDRFVVNLANLARDEDRPTLAKLRRGLGKRLGFAPERDGWVLTRLPANLNPDTLEIYCLVASLFALHPESGSAQSLAASFAEWHEHDRLQLGKPLGERLDNIDRRFVSLLNSDAEDLPERLRRAVALLRSHEIPINWAQLIRDLKRWDYPSRSVQVRWSRHFWAGGPGDNTAPESPTTRSASS